MSYAATRGVPPFARRHYDATRATRDGPSDPRDDEALAPGVAAPRLEGRMVHHGLLELHRSATRATRDGPSDPRDDEALAPGVAAPRCRPRTDDRRLPAPELPPTERA